MSTHEVTARFSRRNLLKTGLASVILLGAGGAWLSLRDGLVGPATPPGLAVLSAEEHAIFAAIAERLCPPLGPGAPGAAALDVATRADALFASAAPDAQIGFKRALHIFENALTGALLGERIEPFTQRTPEEQARELARWRDSKIGFRRTVFHALSSLASSLYYGDERTWERIGYPGPPSLAGLRAAYSENLVDLAALRATPKGEGS